MRARACEESPANQERHVRESTNHRCRCVGKIRTTFGSWAFAPIGEVEDMCAAVDKTQNEEGASQVERTVNLFVVSEDECGPKSQR